VTLLHDFWKDFRRERSTEMGVEWIEQIFKEFPFGVAIAMVTFLGILLVIWLLLPLWVLFIQWNTGKIKDEIRYLVDLMEKKEQDERKKNPSATSDD
jgi:uncharacterized membrane protein YdbT with pleckstrin-like domain